MKTLSFEAHCIDSFSSALIEDGKVIGKYTGYVPNFFPYRGGDDVCLQIDIETGKILNWIPPTDEDLKIFKMSNRKTD